MILQKTSIAGLLLAASAVLCVLAGIACGEEPKAPEAKPATPAKSEAVQTKSETASVKTPSGIVAKVNGVPVTRVDVERTTRILLEQSHAPQDLSPEMRQQAEDAALDQLISTELAYQAGMKLEIKDLDKQVADRVSQDKAQFSTPEEYDAMLKSNGLTTKDVQVFFRKDIVISNLLEKEITSKVTVSEADAKKFYDENRDRFNVPETYHASHILIGVNAQASAEEKQKARAKAEAIRKRALAGEDFAALAKAESSDLSKEQGGDLGTFSKGEMVPSFEKATALLKPGEISEVVETEYGYHIIKLIEKEDARVIKFEEVKEDILNYLTQDKTQRAIADYLAQLRSKATIERPAAK
jgi:peptidyl-prolyl cis-trans isomerase C